MTGLTIFSLFSDFACSSASSKYASDPIDLTNHELDDDHAQDEKENSMRIFMHQNSIAACDRRVRNETSTISVKRDSFKQILLQKTTLASAACQPVDATFQKQSQQGIRERNEECIESRDDTIGTVTSFMDDDLVVAHPSRTDDDEVREEAIEVINISYIHE